MEPDEIPMPRRLAIRRNRGGLLFGSTWSHHASWPWRLTHFYLGLWVLSLRTARSSEERS